MTDNLVSCGVRLALRVEGDNWNAYVADEGTMEGARLIGSIKMACVQKAARKEAFMALMRSVLQDLITDAVGVKPVWGKPQRAPESERAGRA